MCGIIALLVKYGRYDENTNTNTNRNYIRNYKEKVLNSSKKLRHRGPDWSGYYGKEFENHALYMSHERLEIIDPVGGAQPLIHQINNNNISLCVNGEIYNYKNLKQKYNDFSYKTNSDCEVIIPLYLDYLNSFIKYKNDKKKTNDIASDMLDNLDGMFSFVLYDEENDILMVVRDPIGITSLYYGFEETQGDTLFWVSSEMKALDNCKTVLQFPAGHCLLSNVGYFPMEYFTNTNSGKWMLSNKFISENSKDYIDDSTISRYSNNIMTTFTNAVKKRLMTDVPFGILLSGGLDSSLVASVAVKLINDGMKLPWGNNIHTFSIGLEGSPDLKYANIVADFLGTQHHSFTMTVEEGINAIEDVVKHIETYDITTIRASTPMYLLSRKIKAMGVKMVLSGEGSDELLGGYLYFQNAPNDDSFQSECVDRMKNLQYSDCQRANKSTMAWGVEGRFPFLDKDFMECVMKIEPELKCKTITGEHEENGSVKQTRKIEKWILREAFNIKEEGVPVYLPDEILWRQKEQFSDGVGYSWINSLVDIANNKYTDEDLNKASIKYLVNPPSTKEALMYREIYERMFPNRETAVKLWKPRTDWNGVGEDPSGRAQKSHIDFYSKLI